MLQKAFLLWLLLPGLSLGGEFRGHRNAIAGAIPSPLKAAYQRGESPKARKAKDKDDVLDSNQAALIVTERRHVRRDWCKSHPLVQTLHEEGCLTRTVINRFCYGQCNSFFIPSQTNGAEPFRSCSFCKPRNFNTVVVTFNCPGMSPPAKHRRIQLVKECRCISIDLD
ncbi:gremlin-1-like [Latimeria chalumnae]|uniref:Gremlin-1 n=1 Tax=Latimeria chalumnae TaxID=7897 RepID=H3BGP6_LATCH|nr:PREDICTED: gremlin-1-like [Latimeria chalumnae]|eukprot:XP_005987980.1 PREDICTED: gremlin-1-like [Latimeria chalumnae]